MMLTITTWALCAAAGIALGHTASAVGISRRHRFLLWVFSLSLLALLVLLVIGKELGQ